jgi:predicted RNA binding protein YcfA (HicA-like mRNA interferase family)
MPRKIRQLITELQRAEFHFVPGRGSHRKYLHSSGLLVVLSGHSGDDAKPYQEKEVRLKIAEASRHHEN